MDMAPAGIALTEGAKDRDGLFLDALHVPLGPVNKGALGISVAAFLVLAAGAILAPWPAQRRGVPEPRAERTAALGGEAIMGPQMLVMIAVSAALFATIVAGLVLALPHGRYQRFGDDLRGRPAQDPRPGGVGR